MQHFTCDDVVVNTIKFTISKQEQRFSDTDRHHLIGIKKLHNS